MKTCPADEELQRLLTGPLPPDELEHFERHLEICEHCRRQMETLADVQALVPDGPRAWGGDQRASPALQRVIKQLQAIPVPGQSARLPFLQPTDRSGFLGKLGPYEIRREIGRGGMGVVFEGFDPALKRTVAVKVLSPLSAASEEARGRFLREAQSAAALEHENIVPVHAVDQAQGVPFLVMKYVAGESLTDRLDREGRLPFADVVRIGVQVARGLAAAHEKGLVHRDIKPANILLEEPTGRARITDFGLAKAVGGESLTVAGTVAGTPEFMSPEQATGGVVDARSDLFSLGVVLYAGCTGASPFSSESPYTTLDRVRAEEPSPLSQVDPALPEWFCRVVQRLLAKNPQERIQSAAELAELMGPSEPALTRVTRQGDRLTLIDPAANSSRRRVWLAAALLVLAAVLAGGVAFYFSGTDDNRSGPEPTPSPENGFVIAGRAGAYRQLAHALTAARDGDVIEVHGDGPFPTPSLRTGGKRLTLRAAAGSRPILVSDVPGQAQTQPFLTADADLLLENLDIRWTIEARQGMSEPNLMSHCVIVSTAGRLAVVHCRIATGRLNSCVGASGRELVLKNSYFVADQGAGAFLRPAPEGRISVEDCQFETRTAFSVMTASQTINPAPATVLLAGNTFASDGVFRMFMEPRMALEARPRQPLKISAQRNLAASDHVITLYGLRNPKKADLPSPGEMIDQARSFVQWSEDVNVYRRGCKYLACTMPQRPTAHAELDGLGGWLKLWNQPPNRSIEGVIRFRERTASAPRMPLRLDKVDDASGPLPDVLGANPDRLGPR